MRRFAKAKRSAAACRRTNKLPKRAIYASPPHKKIITSYEIIISLNYVAQALGIVLLFLNQSVSLSFVELLLPTTVVPALVEVTTMFPFIDFTVPCVSQASWST